MYILSSGYIGYVWFGLGIKELLLLFHNKEVTISSENGTLIRDIHDYLLRTRNPS